MRLYGSKIGCAAAVLLLNANAAFALPDCPKTDFPHNCFDKYTWDDGTKYVGDWQDATFNGQGTLTYSNGDRYVGEWRNGKKHGKGSYKSARSRGFKQSEQPDYTARMALPGWSPPQITL